VGLRAGLNVAVKRENPCPCWELNHSCPAHSLVIILTDVSQLRLSLLMEVTDSTLYAFFTLSGGQ